MNDEGHWCAWVYVLVDNKDGLRRNNVHSSAIRSTPTQQNESGRLPCNHHSPASIILTTPTFPPLSPSLPVTEWVVYWFIFPLKSSWWRPRMNNDDNVTRWWWVEEAQNWIHEHPRLVIDKYLPIHFISIFLVLYPRLQSSCLRVMKLFYRV